MLIDDTDLPLVFLDVDGPLIPFRARPIRHRPPSRDRTDPGREALGNPLLDRLDPADARRLLGLGCQLVWATTWMAEANEVISPLLGFPELSVVDFPATDDEPVRGLHWKTMFLTRWAAGRPFVWIDDETTDRDRHWVAAPIRGRLWCTVLTRSSVFATQTSPLFIDGSKKATWGAVRFANVPRPERRARTVSVRSAAADSVAAPLS